MLTVFIIYYPNKKNTNRHISNLYTSQRLNKKQIPCKCSVVWKTRLPYQFFVGLMYSKDQFLIHYNVMVKRLWFPTELCHSCIKSTWGLFSNKLSTTEESAMVVTSPMFFSFFATFRKTRRMILPERVFGSPGEFWMISGVAKGPILVRTKIKILQQKFSLDLYIRSEYHITGSVVSLFTNSRLHLEFVNSDTTQPLMLYTLLIETRKKSTTTTTTFITIIN